MRLDIPAKVRRFHFARQKIGSTDVLFTTGCLSLCGDGGAFIILSGGSYA